MTKAHLDLIRSLPCCVCGAIGVHAHHAGGGSMTELGFTKAKGMKHSDYLAIPLCPDHHTGANGIHSLGVATWERLHGTQHVHLIYLSPLPQIDLIALAMHDKRERKPRKASSKIVPRTGIA